MLKDKQMSIVVYYYLETGKSRNFLGIQISKVKFFLLVFAKLFTKCYAKCKKKENPLLQSSYYVSPEVLMSNNYKVLLYSSSGTQIIGKDFKIKKCFSNLTCIKIT